MIDYSQSLLFDALVAAFGQKKTTEHEQLPQGVSKVEYWHPRNWKERFHILRDKAIVTVDGVPNKEHYQKSAEGRNLTLVDRAEALFEGLQQKGQVGLNIENIGDVPVASVSYIPGQMQGQHEFTVYSPHNAGLGAAILANYLTLQRG